MATICADLLDGGLKTVVWLGGSVFAALLLALFAPSKRVESRWPSWLAVGAAFAIGVGTFAYVVAAPEERCDGRNLPALFAVVPFALSALVFGTLSAVRAARRER